MPRFKNSLMGLSKIDYINSEISNISLEPMPKIQNFLVYQYHDIISFNPQNNRLLY